MPTSSSNPQLLVVIVGSKARLGCDVRNVKQRGVDQSGSMRLGSIRASLVDEELQISYLGYLLGRKLLNHTLTSALAWGISANRLLHLKPSNISSLYHETVHP